MSKILSSVYTFILVGILFLGCSYWIYKNIEFKDLIDSTTIPSKTSENADINDTNGKINIEVRNSNIVKVVSPTVVEPIISGNEIENFESFSDVSVSSDGKKVCFIVHTITPLWLYVSNIDGSSLRKVDLGKNCIWSPDSKYIAYNNYTSDVSTVSVKIYNFDTGEIKDLIGSHVKSGFIRVYSTPRWTSNTMVEASYSEFLQSNMKNQTFGKSTINIESGEVLD